MSRIAPVQKAKNPASRYYEWCGGVPGGYVTYYDKNVKNEKGEMGANIITKLPFAFIVLDETSTIRGWCDQHESSLFSNEVKDTVAEPFVVKAFDGPVIAEGFYREIRDKVAASGGRFTANVYIAYKDVDKLRIGSIQFHGAALNAWVEFRKASGNAIYSKAVKIESFLEGKKGAITFRTPVFKLIDVSKDADDAAGVLQQELAKYHVEYFARAKQQAATPEATAPAAQPARSNTPVPERPAFDEPPPQEPPPQPADDGDVPF